MSKQRIPKKVMDLLRPLLAEVWEAGYHEGYADNATQYGRRSKWTVAKNPYEEETE